ncbi:hypothetical protein J1N35_004710 [Gossypium stocksii]|uniref:Uncharacterized protein n=1 Tax=Gossypium stocksii TaxID=47602 RepID=A0A9D4AIK4_9ROSI|nr:hypothetical protein J1N35_004710 [Gossypium stocksii]
MLAKQSWRMIAEPRSLWVKVLKGLYFPHKSIMKEEKGSRASSIWSSLVEDRWVRGIRGDRIHHPSILEEDLTSKVAEIIYKEEGT